MTSRVLGIFALTACLACDTVTPVPGRGEPVVPTAEGAMTCDQVIARVRSETVRAQAANDACTSDNDCVPIASGTACQGECSVYVNQDRQASFQAAMANISDRFCKAFTPPCAYSTPGCVASRPACNQGHCTWGPPL